MLPKIRDLQGDWIHAADGEVGSVDDLYFDDQGWDVRYLLVNTRRWIPGRKYLVSPIAIDRERPLDEGDIRVELTREQISRCPTVPGDSRQWLPGKLLLISPEVIARIDWPEKKVHLRLAREDILQAPEVPL